MKKTSLFLMGAVITAGVSTVTPMAQAGFEWNPPVKKVVSVEKFEQEIGVKEKDADARDWMTPIEWVDTLDTAQTKEKPVSPQMPVMEKAYVDGVEKEVLKDGGTLQVEMANPVEPAPVMMDTPSTVAGQSSIMDEVLAESKKSRGFVHVQDVMKAQDIDAEVVEGFGSDMPLVVALRQIVPSNYQFVFANDVDLSQSVDWRGGAPWTEVLTNVLDPSGYTYTVNGKMVTVGHAVTFPVAQMAEVPSEVVTPVAQPAEQLVTPVQTPPVAKAVRIDNAWSAKSGDMLYDVMKAWAKRAGTEVYWSLDYDYELNKDMNLSGDYEVAIEKLLNEFKNVTPRPYGQLHVSSNGPKVLIVKAYGS